MAAPGVVTVVLRRPDGEAVWADAMPVLQGLAPESVDLYFTSPPYHLQRAKEYGSFESERAYIEWLVPFAQEMHRTLRGTGSMVLNLGLGPYVQGSPTRSPLVHRLVLRLLDDLGWHLAGEHVWVNPACLPSPAEWVTRRRVQVKDGYELSGRLPESLQGPGPSHPPGTLPGGVAGLVDTVPDRGGGPVRRKPRDGGSGLQAGAAMARNREVGCLPGGWSGAVRRIGAPSFSCVGISRHSPQDGTMSGNEDHRAWGRQRAPDVPSLRGW